MDKDSLESDKPYSFSYAHSPLGGIQYDGLTGSPISFSYKDLFAADIDISEYEQGGEVSKFVYIPPARGINRIVEEGEVGHVRSKFMLMKGDDEVNGFGANPGVPPPLLDFLVIPAKTSEEVIQHIKATRVFFNKVRTVIVGNDIK